MALSLYDATVPSFIQGLTAVGGLVEKARAHCAEQGIDEGVLCGSSIAPDMWPFAKQVICACQHSAEAVAAVFVGHNGPDMAPGPMNFAELSQRVNTAVESLKAVTPEQLEAVAESDLMFQIGERQMPFTATGYLLSFAMPNFYFHSATAYAVLRNQGLAIGKRDILGAPRMKG